MEDDSHTPDIIGIWNDGIDEVVFSFDAVIDGNKNFLAIHQNDFAATNYQIEAYLFGVPIDYSIVELNNSSGSMAIIETVPAIILNDPNADAGRRHLVRFNQPFDSIRIVEDNPFDLSAYGFFGTGAKANILFGDVNCDAVVNLLDVLPFVDLIVTSSYNPKGDFNMDGAVDLLDVASFVDLLTGP